MLLRGVKHASDVRFNLIFVQVLDDVGYDNHFGSAKWKLTKGDLVVAKREKGPSSREFWEILLCEDLQRPELEEEAVLRA